jgi:hypothetical protein
MKIILLIISMICMVSCGQRGVLKEITIGRLDEKLLQHSFKFITPTRRSPDHDWGYMMSFVSNEKPLVGSGRYSIRDTKNHILVSGEFSNSSLIESSWHSDKSKVSYLFGEKFILKNYTNYTLELELDSSITHDVQVCLHYLDVKK